MRVLVTGGAGFIGTAVVDTALAAGWQVRVLDSLDEELHGDRPSVRPEVELLTGDVRHEDTVAPALHRVDLVVHLAAKVGLGVDYSDAPDYVSTNDLGTAVVLACMARAAVPRLVLASSMVVYGDGAYTGADGPAKPLPRTVEDLDAGRFEPTDATGQTLTPALTDEDATLDPRNVYAASKVAQEHLANAWARATGGVAAALRFHNVYGPGMPRDTPYAGVASLFRSAVERGEPPRVFEDGGQRRDFVHVRDVAAANLAAARWTGSAAPGRFRAFNVGSGTVHTIGELAEQVSKHRGGPPPVVTGEYRLGDVRHITASSARLRTELSWAPEIGFEEGMREFATAPLRGAAR